MSNKGLVTGGVVSRLAVLYGKHTAKMVYYRGKKPLFGLLVWYVTIPFTASLV